MMLCQITPDNARPRGRLALGELSKVGVTHRFDWIFGWKFKWTLSKVPMRTGSEALDGGACDTKRTFTTPPARAGRTIRQIFKLSLWETFQVSKPVRPGRVSWTDRSQLSLAAKLCNRHRLGRICIKVKLKFSLIKLHFLFLNFFILFHSHFEFKFSSLHLIQMIWKEIRRRICE